MSEDVREHPHAWSLLACAILKQYHQDVKRGRKDAYINDEWYDILLTLANRFAGVPYVPTI